MKHCEQLHVKHRVDLARLFCPEKCDFYKQQIVEDVEGKLEKWLSREPIVSNDSNSPLERCDGPERPIGFLTGCHFSQLTAQTSLSSLDRLVMVTVVQLKYPSKTTDWNRNGTAWKIVY